MLSRRPSCCRRQQQRRRYQRILSSSSPSSSSSLSLSYSTSSFSLKGMMMIMSLLLIMDLLPSSLLLLVPQHHHHHQKKKGIMILGGVYAQDHHHQQEEEEEEYEVQEQRQLVLDEEQAQQQEEEETTEYKDEDDNDDDEEEMEEEQQEQQKQDSRFLLRTRYPPPTQPVTTTSTEMTLENQRSNLELLLSQEPSIVGGKIVENGRYPYMVSLQTSKFGSSLVCGGSLVARDIVITAGHCAQESAWAQLSKHSLYETTTESYSIEKKIVHPHYHSKYLFHDIAILKLSQSASNDIQPITITHRAPPQPVNVGDDVVITGWGRLEYNGILSSELKEGKINVIDDATCENRYYKKSDGGYYDRIFQMCCQSETTDACNGDSGGPCIKVGNKPEDDVLVGIVSWGVGCAHAYYPGVYTKLTAYHRWIHRTICDNSRHGCIDDSYETVTTTKPPTTTTKPPTTAAPTPKPPTIITGVVQAPKAMVLDVALGAMVQASSYRAPHVPERAVDFRSDTEWRSSGSELKPWFEVTLNKSYRLTHIALQSRLGSAANTNYPIEFRATFSNGSSQNCKFDTTRKTSLQYFNINDITSSKVRITVTKKVGIIGAVQISAYAPLPDVIEGKTNAPNNLINVARINYGVTIQASSFFQNSNQYHPNNAIDGNINTQWASNSEGVFAWYKINFNRTRRLKQFGYVSRGGVYGKTYQFRLKFSNGEEELCVVDSNANAKTMQYFNLGDSQSDNDYIATTFVLFEIVEGNKFSGAVEMAAFV